MNARDRLILALDHPTLSEAEAMIERTRGSVGVYKVGYQLAFAGGLALAERLAKAGTPVFLDMKLHDIGYTVGNGVASIARMGVRFLTVHGYPQTMRAAVAARGSSDLKILAVTVLTSYDDDDLTAAGYARGIGTLAAERARQARDLGVDGLICSPEEAERLRAIVGREMLLVTPGIRPAGTDAGDQKRFMTPARAIAAGADYLVVGRPILQAADPKAAADAIVAEIESAMSRPKGGTMPKGYWVAHVDVHGQDSYQTYVKELPAIFKKFGGRYLTRGGKFEDVEGKSRSRNIVIEFPSYDQAMACYRSPEYQAAAKYRHAGAEADISVLEGYDGPQPTD